MTIRVAIADDDALLRAGLAVVLGHAADLELVGQVGDGLAVVDLCRTTRPHVVLMDVRMPGIDGIEATRRITGSPGGPRVLVLTTVADDELVMDALHAGASGFLLKRSSPEQLVEAVRTVAAGEALLDSAVTQSIVERVLRGAASARCGSAEGDRLLSRLTEREREVLRLVGEGLSNHEIASLLVIAESTAKTHVKRVLSKVGARDRAQAVVFAHRCGLVHR